MVSNATLGLILAAMVAIIGASALAPKLGVASPLLLVIFGFLLSHIPGLPTFEVHPELIFLGVLPPLLYATAVNVPTLDLKRNWGPISGLSILLVVATAVVFGVVLHLWLPGLDLAPAIAAGAILSPTGAVATSVAKKVRAPHRLITMLEGEGLLNDAMALVVLRTAIATMVATFSIVQVFGRFLWFLIGGIISGFIVGVAGVWLRKLIKLPELTTALTFVVPFASFLAAEALGASGEMGVVVTGLFTGWAGIRYLEPQDRQYGQYNWLTIATMLEGALFFLMGLELSKVVYDTRTVAAPEHHIWLLAVLSGAILLAVRAFFVFPLLAILNRSERFHRHHSRSLEEHLPSKIRKLTQTNLSPQDIDPKHSGALRKIADAKYKVREHLGKKEGIAILWSGMRGAVTLAAAQTLPWDFPYRSLLIFLAALVAAGTLLIQGFTLPILLKRLSLVDNRIFEPSHIKAIRTILKDSSESLLGQKGLKSLNGDDYDDGVLAEVRESLQHEPSLLFIAEELEDASDAGVLRELEANGNLSDEKAALIGRSEWHRLQQFLELRRRVVAHQHKTLLEVTSLGTHDSDAITRVFDTLDADQMAVELRLESVHAAE